MLCLGTQKAFSGVVDPSEAYDLLKFITLLTGIVFWVSSAQRRAIWKKAKEKKKTQSSVEASLK